MPSPVGQLALLEIGPASGTETLAGALERAAGTKLAAVLELVTY